MMESSSISTGANVDKDLSNASENNQTAVLVFFASFFIVGFFLGFMSKFCSSNKNVELHKFSGTPISLDTKTEEYSMADFKPKNKDFSQTEMVNMKREYLYKYVTNLQTENSSLFMSDDSYYDECENIDSLPLNKDELEEEKNKHL